MEYQKMHVDHLKILYNITSEPILKEYADKFNKYIDDRNNYEELLKQYINKYGPVNLRK
jgi:hypothetical protein